MAVKTRIPYRPPNCETCHKPKGAKGYYGPECMCEEAKRTPVAGHTAGQTRKV